MNWMQPGWRGLAVAVLQTLAACTFLLAVTVAVAILYPRIHAR